MDYKLENTRYVAHEVKNQLSVCDLYTEILRRYCEKNGFQDDTIINSIDCIKRALALAGNSLLELKSIDSLNINKYSIKELLQESYNLSTVYTLSKNIRFFYETGEDYEVSIDKNKFLGGIINLVKNASEAFDCDDETNYIKITYQKIDSLISIVISNNAPPIERTDLFEEGVTTKETGSGLGLYISRRSMEDMGGTLKLLKSDSVSTEFEIQLPLKNN